MTDDSETRDDVAERIGEAVHRAVVALMEHCDTVQIFVTKHCPGGGDDANTLGYTTGQGNWYARMGQVSDWLAKQRRHTEREADTDHNSGDL